MTLLALTLALAAPAALACRGPFSAAYQIHLRPEHRVYVGRVVSLDTPTARGLTTLEVLHGWERTLPDSILVRGLGMSVGSADCVATVLPRKGETWLVVVRPDHEGKWAAEYLMSLNLATPDGLKGLEVVKQKKGSGKIRKLKPRGTVPTPL